MKEGQLSFAERLYTWAKHKVESNENNPREIKKVLSILRSLKIRLKAVLSHFELCKQRGKINYSELGLYFPADIDNLTKLHSKYEGKFNEELNEEYRKVIEYLSTYNSKFSKLEEGREKLKEREEKIMELLKKTIAKVNKVIRDTQFKR